MQRTETSDKSDLTQIDTNFESEYFDAKAALLNDNCCVAIPVADATTYNNIDEYVRKTCGKSNAIELFESKEKQKSDKLIVRNVKILETLTAPKPQKQLSTVLTKMKQTTGPYAMLYKAINNRIKVLIRRRKRTEIQCRFGWVNGLLIAFDKHYNLVLTDVDETHHIIKCNENIEICNHIKQLLIRGDNVVLISLP